ncbi:MAG: signal peptidase II [Anaerolineaceae bacterium]|nr:signal peptidase II [Anaerolineaceae bacterium]MCB9101221.1 signal peptidase II [Anaerolineales bacterium]
MKVLSRLLLAMVLVFILDGLTKIWVEHSLALYEPVPVLGEFFRLTLGYNTGVAFGLFANGGIWPMIITGVIIAIIAVWFIRGLLSGHFSAHAAWPVGMLLGGAIGNFVDRVIDGRVTDFLDVGLGAARWPTFNLADSFILMGVGLLMLFSFHHQPENTDHRLDNSPPESDPNSLPL